MAKRQGRRILFVQTQAENAGAQEISRLLGEGLKARGHEVHHVFFYRKTDGFDGMENTTICCRERPGNLFPFLRFYRGLIATIRQINPDIVFTFQHFGNVMGAPAARLAGIDNVIANQVSARETINPLVRALDLVLGMSRLYRRITVNSNALLRDYQNFPQGYQNKLLHVPHGFEDKTADLSRLEARAIHGLPADAPLLGTVARLNQAKQIDCAIALLTKDRSWRLVIAGQGEDAPRLRALAAAADVGERVIFLGELPQGKIGGVLAALDVFVFPSRAETFGLAAVEAAQCGIPVVANNLDVLREVLAVDGEPCADFVDVKDVAQFAGAVRRILEDREYAQKMSALGRKLKEKYSLQAMVDAYEAMALDLDVARWQVRKPLVAL